MSKQTIKIEMPPILDYPIGSRQQAAALSQWVHLIDANIAARERFWNWQPTPYWLIRVGETAACRLRHL